MIMRTKVDCLIFLLLIALNCPVFAADPDYETVGPIEVETVLPPALLHAAAYSINAEVVAEDNFYHFSITSDYATYKVASVAMLRQRLFEIATIAEAAAIGVPYKVSGETLRLVVVARKPNLDESAVIDLCRQYLTGYKIPRSVVITSELPKSAIGKILRRAVREKYGETTPA